MNEELAEKKVIVDDSRRHVEGLIRDIDDKREKANRRQEDATAAARQISEDQTTITREKRSADEALDAAIPALEAAARALESLDKKDITEIKAFSTPPKPVMYVCMCVVVLRPLGKENEADGWNGARGMLNDVNFLKALLEYPKDNITGRKWHSCKQAFSWIKRREENNNLIVKTFGDDYLKQLELAIQYGRPFVFENVEETLDPLIDPLLEKAVAQQNGEEFIILGERITEGQ
ncbi:UNVERIFIED_CONTAM: hypothetical protein H355_014889 [Colinus virginianus]|nr:hypothetical protein H355_014889 [Colinus virginianus]